MAVEHRVTRGSGPGLLAPAVVALRPRRRRTTAWPRRQRDAATAGPDARRAPIYLANGPDSELRAVSISAPGGAWVPFEDGWPVLQRVGPGNRPDDLPRRVASGD
jgi:hypothetical protein